MATTDKKMLFRIFPHALTVTALFVLSACATTQPQSASVSKPAAASTSAAAAPVAEAEVADTFEGDGMEIPLDGSSLAAFEASMARVKRHASEDNYITLENAIEYLLVYDLEVKRNKDKLAAKLDGLNGYEVIARVGWRKPPPGKSKAVKGAADATIDT
jgi:hypothetical protein